MNYDVNKYDVSEVSYSQLWKERLSKAIENVAKDYIGGIPPYKDGDSIGDFSDIDSGADYKPGTTDLSTYLKDKGYTSYWNESIKELCKTFYNMLPEETEFNKHWGKESFQDLIDELNHADAGFSFTSAAYVKPDENYDNETYENVRGEDAIESVLQNKKNLDFTNDQDKEDGENTYTYIRLLMPRYTRRVEVEDLNRNFWVIAQAIGILSAYLTDPNSPLNKILGALINELGELWNNVYELWAAIGGLYYYLVDIDDKINELGKAASKIPISINLGFRPSNTEEGREWRNFLTGDPDGTEKLVVEDVFYIGDSIEGSFINTEYESVKNFCSFITDYYGVDSKPTVDSTTGTTVNGGYKFVNDGGKTILDGFYLSWDGKNKQNQYFCSFSEIDGGDTYYANINTEHGTEEAVKVCAPRIGLIVKFTKNGVQQYAGYDFRNPYIFLYKDSFGVYQYANSVVSDQTYLMENKIIYEELLKNPNADLGKTATSFANITVSRDSFNTRPLSEMITELMGLNIIIKDLTVSNLQQENFCSADFMPREVSPKEFLRKFFSEICISALETTADIDGTVKIFMNNVRENAYNDGKNSSSGLSSFASYWNVLYKIFLASSDTEGAFEYPEQGEVVWYSHTEEDGTLVINFKDDTSIDNFNIYMKKLVSAASGNYATRIENRNSNLLTSCCPIAVLEAITGYLSSSGITISENLVKRNDDSNGIGLFKRTNGNGKTAYKGRPWEIIITTIDKECFNYILPPDADTSADIDAGKVAISYEDNEGNNTIKYQGFYDYIYNEDYDPIKNNKSSYSNYQKKLYDNVFASRLGNRDGTKDNYGEALMAYYLYRGNIKANDVGDNDIRAHYIQPFTSFKGYWLSFTGTGSLNASCKSISLVGSNMRTQCNVPAVSQMQYL